MERFRWPDGFARIPDEDWARQSLESLALKYDSVENHGWYRNLEPTLDQLQAKLEPGQLLIDYSGGTGILVDRLLKRDSELDAGLMIIDASPKFLRLALEKLGKDERLAFRWIRYLKEERRLERMDEVVGDAWLERGADIIASTNAIHLYYGLDETLRSWLRVLKPGGTALIQSGNIRNPAAGDEWIIDETVGAIHRTAMQIVRDDDAYAEYRGGLDDSGRMERYDRLRDKYFIPVRPLGYYEQAITNAGFAIDSIEKQTIEAKVQEWYEFLAVYHDGVLGWLGGVEKIDGRPASEQAVKDRLRLIRASMDQLFNGGESFDACWTYLTCRKPA